MRAKVPSLIVSFAALLGSAPAARATECGEARQAVAHFKHAASVEESLHHSKEAHEAHSGLATAEHKLQSACQPHRVSIAALPLGFVTGAPGNASKTTVDPPPAWQLVVTTRAGAGSGIVFAEPAELEAPGGMHWETAPNAKATAETLLAVATDAQLIVEEPEAGQGTWKIELKNKPQLVPVGQVRACAGGKGDAGVKLDKASCQMLARVDPTASGLPERGRAVLVGEWQYGWHSTIETGDLEMSEAPSGGPPPRVDLTLTLSAPVPGVSDGKRLDVTVEANKQNRPAGTNFRLAHTCADEDDACQKQRLAVEVWFDRAFGLPYLRVPPSAVAQGKAMGKVADRLARPMVGQRVMVMEGARKIITMSDDVGEYHFGGLSAGPVTVFAVGKKPTDKPGGPGGDESRKVSIGVAETKVPILYVNKLFE
jgi:hypothetical protein